MPSDDTVSSEQDFPAPPVDVPSPTLRWDGLVMAIDASTLNAIARRAIRRLPLIKEVSVDPEDGRLGIRVRVRKGIPVSFRSHIQSLRFKDGFLGFSIVDLKVARVVPIPDWVVRRIVEHQPPGRAFFYPAGRIVVINLNHVLPPELSVQVKDVVCENGEMRFVFGPSQYRLDRFIKELGTDPFSDEE